MNLVSNGSEDIYISKHNSSGGLVWARSIGGIVGDEAYGIDVDGMGNVYVTGLFRSTVDFDPGPGEMNLIGGASGDIFIAKFDSGGNFVWARSFTGSSNNSGRGVAVDAAGNVYATGKFGETVDFDPGPTTVNLASNGFLDIYVLRLDSDGNLDWVRQFGSDTSNDQGFDIDVDAMGSVYTTGLFGGTVDFDPGPGTANLTANGTAGGFVSKLDSTGNYVWAKAFDGPALDEGLGIRVDGDGDVYTTGFFGDTVDFDPGSGTANLTAGGSADVFISKLDSGGGFVWAKNLGGSGSDVGYGVDVDSSGNVYASGSFQSTVDFDPGPGIANLDSQGGRDIYAAKFDAEGNFLDAAGFGSTNDDIGRDLALGGSDSVFVTGYFQGTVDFDPGPDAVNLTSNSNSLDIFVLQLTEPVPAVAASKEGALNLASDAAGDNDGELDPGEIIDYTVTITNTGNAAATDVVFRDSLDPRTTLVSGSVSGIPQSAVRGPSVLTTDYLRNRVYRLAIDGSVIGTPILASEPGEAVLGPDGMFYVRDDGRFDDDVIARVDETNNTLVPLTAPGLIPGGRGFDFGPNGNIFVADATAGKIIEFDGATGAMVGDFVTGLDVPIAVRFGPDGNLYVGRRHHQSASTDWSVLVFDGTTATPLGVFTDVGVDTPQFMIFGPDGDLFVSNQLSDNAFKQYDGMTGQLVFGFEPDESNSQGMAFHPNGEFLATTFGSSVMRYDADTGESLGDFFTATSSAWLFGLAVRGSGLAIDVGTIAPDESIEITFQVIVNDLNNGLATPISNQGTVSGSNFSDVLTDDPNTPSPSDATQVPLDSLSLGDRIWLDGNRDGVYQSASEVGIGNVSITLFTDNGGTPGQLDANDNPVATTISNNTTDLGAYSFDKLLPGEYIVRLDDSNFGSGGALAGLLTFPNEPAPDPDNDLDHDDNGDALFGSGVVTQPITLDYGTEPDGDANTSVDFGFLDCSVVVTNTNDDGAGSLRDAIECANLRVGIDTISFDIDGAVPYVIQPLSPLPQIRDPVTIDGTSEPDYAEIPVVEIDGSMAGAGAHGLTVGGGGDGSTIRGLAINRFDANGIFVSRRNNISIEGNYLGTDTSGTVDLGNGEAGVYIINGQNNSVRDNLISGNDKGVLIEGSQSTGNVIATNVIGTNADGTDTLSNQRPTANIDIAGAPGNMVGGPGGAGNVIGGGKVGVSIRGATATGNVIQGNFIGNNGAGTAVANTRGVEIKTDASGNSIGGAGDAANVISGNTKGIEVNRADGNSIRGNMIGVNQAGDAPLENVRGVLVRNSANNQIGGGGSSANVISGNVRQGVRILLGDSTGNVVIGNFIGTDAAGNAGIANRNGVVISPGADGNTVGGMTAAERNVISGNTRAGVVLQANNNLVVGNFIGTDATGTAAVGNETGVLIDDTTGNTIGGAFGSSGGNVISGNAEAGVRVTRDGATGNTVTGNAIGTDPTGMTAVGNKHGVLIESAANTVGGGTANDGNVISGNTQNGVYLIGAAATGNLIQNNRIGINIDGTAALANERSGVLIEEAPGNTIGGNGTGNAIGGNTLQGIRIAGAGATGNLVQGNSIGLDGLTMTAVANRDGIRIADDASGNTIGGADGLANEIAQNTRIGIYISDGASNTVTQNSIHDNGTLGISLGALGETPNDDDDGDTGANNLQNSPVIQRVELVGASLEVTFLTNSAAGNSNYGVSGLSIEFFIADSDDEEGQTFLSQVFYDAPINVVTLTIPAGSAGLGTKIVATATDDDGNTSEFSAAVAVDEHVADSLFEELGG